MQQKTQTLIPSETIAQKIFLIRGQKVMLDRYLAILYSVSTKRLNEQVKRNRKRFPEDFMFRLTEEEARILRSQIATSSWGGRRYLPYAFTEQGVAMLSSVLNSERAIQVNIAIMRTFTRLREMMMHYAKLKKELADMDRKYNKRFKITDKRFQLVFEAIKRLTIEKEKPKKLMGFCLAEEKRKYEKKRRVYKKRLVSDNFDT